ncbi:MAG TPA: helix-hairpin-helix domain-containing protein [Pyrinomonadaceae bacterium]|jgi:competence protein ComEA
MRQKFRARPRRFFQFIFLSWLLIAAGASCVRLPRRTTSAAGQNAPPAARLETPSEALININTATPEELDKLPGIGAALAARIVEHRERYGRFRRAEHLLMVRGISERRYQTISALVTTE